MNKSEMDRAIRHIRANLRASLLEYGQHIIEVREEEKWKYAIPENYTNYQDGFLVQDGEPYRGYPLLNYGGTILYVFRTLSWADMAEDEKEKILLYDRRGNKYTFIVKQAETPMEDGNPSYYEFIKRVKKYVPRKSYRKSEERS